MPEQEDRLLKHCAVNNIEVKGVFRENFSAKDFYRPEWKKLIATIKGSRSQEPGNIIFIKWDRFSRKTGYAYEMIGMLRKLNVVAMAIDQPIHFDVPASGVMLAVYLSIPESENLRMGTVNFKQYPQGKAIGSVSEQSTFRLSQSYRIGR